jgi:hypothetical protein
LKFHLKMNQPLAKYENLKVVELQKICKQYKISYAGRKQQLIDRLNEHDHKQQVAQAAAAQLNNNQADDDDGSDSDGSESDESQESDEEDPNESSGDSFVLNPVQIESESETSHTSSSSEEHHVIAANGKRKKIFQTYDQHDIFDSLDLAREHMKNEAKWNKNRQKSTDEGVKLWYTCKVKSCSLKAYILLHQSDQRVSIWYSDSEHQHDNVQPKKKPGLNPITKHQIRILFQTGVTQPKRIQKALRLRFNETMPDNPDVPNPLYVPGLEVPEKRSKISNYISKTLKRQLVSMFYRKN